MDLFELKSRFNNASYFILKKILFCFSPEKVHHFFLKMGKIFCKFDFMKKILSFMFSYEHHSLEQTLFGIKFINPVGLSAGFDKNAELIGIMNCVGFGFSEVGSVTALPCAGNSGIRLKRITDKKSIWVNMGLNNEGALKIRDKLKGKKFSIPFGINVAKTNCVETVNPEIGLKDYIYSLKSLRNLGNYFTINISCPNAFGGQPFSNPELYEKLLYEIDKLKIKKPIFVKLSPDLSKRQIDLLFDISLKHNISGFVCSNLTKCNEHGGYSGKIVEDKSNILLSYLYGKTKKSGRKYVLIGSGGIFSAEDAYKKIKLGANLVELITGMIYKGPGLIGEINYSIVKLLEKDGFRNVSEAVGSGY